MNYNIKHIANKEKNKKDIRSFITKKDHAFNPPISDQVNINEYVDKIFKNGIFIGCKVGDKVKGVIGFYCNDKENYVGYITYLAVCSSERGKGIGDELVNRCLEACGRNQMSIVRVKTWSENKPAIRLYSKNGFEVIDKYVDDFDVTKVVLEKQIE